MPFGGSSHPICAVVTGPAVADDQHTDPHQPTPGKPQVTAARLPAVGSSSAPLSAVQSGPLLPLCSPTITRHDPTVPLRWMDASLVGQRNCRSDQHRQVVAVLVHELDVVGVAVGCRDREPFDEFARATTDHATAITPANDIRVGGPLVAVRVVTNDQPEDVRPPANTAPFRAQSCTDRPPAAVGMLLVRVILGNFE